MGPLAGGPGSLPVTRLHLLSAGLQLGAEQAAGEAGYAGSVLGVLSGSVGPGPGLTEVASLGQDRCNSLFCFRD